MKQLPGKMKGKSADSLTEKSRFLASLALIVLILITSAPAQLNRNTTSRKTASSDRSETQLATITVTTTADVIDAAGTCSAVTLASLPGPGGQTSLARGDLRG